MYSLNRTVNYFLYEKLKYMSRFAIVGLANALVGFLIFTISNGLIGMSYTLSQVTGFSFEIINSLMLNGTWNFEDRNSEVKTFREFIVANMISLITTVVVMKLLII